MGASPRQRTGRMQQQAQHPYARDNPIATAQRARAKRRWPLYIAAYVAVGSLAAICKTALQPPIADKGANTLLVIAHPDDETMFFSPAIATIAAFQASIFVLCLSTGNAYGEGSRRCKELRQACDVLQIASSRVSCVDSPDLPDGMHTVWPSEAVQGEVSKAVTDWSIDTIVTFDSGGVSGHPNHHDIHRGVRDYLKQRETEKATPIRSWALESTNIVRKYSGLLDLLPSAVMVGVEGRLALNPLPWRTVAAMAQHRSQLVWYRYLFIAFSRYTWVNTLKPLTAHMEPSKQGQEEVVVADVAEQ